MKIFILIIVILISGITNGVSQNSLRIFGGANITNTNYHLINRSTGFDSTRLRKDNYILPLLGVDIDFLLSPKLSCTSGIGVSWMGSRNYLVIPNESIRKDSHLRLGYLRVPLIINYQLFNKLKFIGGYTFNYNFRKNQLLNSFDENNFIIYTYKPFHHAAIVGIRLDNTLWNIIINYHKGISKIWDTKNFNRDYRAYLTLGGIQVSIGYLINEEK